MQQRNVTRYDVLDGASLEQVIRDVVGMIGNIGDTVIYRQWDNTRKQFMETPFSIRAFLSFSDDKKQEVFEVEAQGSAYFATEDFSALGIVPDERDSITVAGRDYTIVAPLHYYARNYTVSALFEGSILVRMRLVSKQVSRRVSGLR